MTIAPFERTLVCVKCLQPRLVIELPYRYLDANTYVGGCCLRPKPKPKEARP